MRSVLPLFIAALFAGFRAEPLPSRAAGPPCAGLVRPWAEARHRGGPRGPLYRLRVRAGGPGAPSGPVFPEQPLFRFVRRVYRCCQSGLQCAGLRGIQGREAAGFGIEFLLSEDVLSSPVSRAEIHLQLSNPKRLEVQPLLPSLEKRQLATRYSVWSEDSVLDLRVDLTFLFQALQQAVGGGRGSPSLLNIRRVGGLGRPWGSEPRDKTPHDPVWAELGEGNGDGWTENPPQGAVELGLSLHCRTGDASAQPCQSHGVRLLHTPFITLSYR